MDCPGYKLVKADREELILIQVDLIYDNKIVASVKSSDVPPRGAHIDVRIPGDPDPGLTRVVVERVLWVVDEGASVMRAELLVKTY